MKTQIELTFNKETAEKFIGFATRYNVSCSIKREKIHSTDMFKVKILVNKKQTAFELGAKWHALMTDYQLFSHENFIVVPRIEELHRNGEYQTY